MLRRMLQNQQHQRQPLPLSYTRKQHLPQNQEIGRTSVASSAGGASGAHRVHKNSSARSGSMRPRANTLSHVEGAFMQLTMDQMATESLAAEESKPPTSSQSCP
ncbi:hypothetical protein EYC84_008473 [Monilinia fructicola]|uniref:Uncharacterized protein n=1 Tax=Monilinia fructicola TaxID=38448 RepID=A0A5M9JFA2_MONFR|nr:hypothetical protein EYC84_008473 [Monilinia fructicola]